MADLNLSAMSLHDIDVVILAGGRGTRLQSVVPDRPKCLAPIHGSPFLRHYLDWLAKFGARRVILALGYMAGMVKTYVESETWPGLEIETFVEPEALGTGGAVRAVLPLIHSDTALVTNGDSVTRLDLREFVAFHRRKQARLSMVLTHVSSVRHSGRVLCDPDGLVTAFEEKPGSGEEAGYINAGIYLMNRDVIAEIPAAGSVSIEREVFPRLCVRGFYALRGEFPFIDIGTPDSYGRAAEFFAHEST